MWSRQVIKQKAMERFRANYWPCVLAGVILQVFLTTSIGISITSSAVSSMASSMTALLTGSGSSTSESMAALIAAIAVLVVVATIIFIVGTLLNIFLVNPFILGCRRFFMSNINGKARPAALCAGFKVNYFKRVSTMFLMGLCTALWCILFAVPGIIKVYEYRMIPYLLMDYPEMSRKEIFATSKRMMAGNKWKAFVFDWSFFGWQILSSCTSGLLGIFFVSPYIHQANAMLYDAIKYEKGMVPQPAPAPVERVAGEPVF